MRLLVVNRYQTSQNQESYGMYYINSMKCVTTQLITHSIVIGLLVIETAAKQDNVSRKHCIVRNALVFNKRCVLAFNKRC